jgi:copper chaperone CopZ
MKFATAAQVMIMVVVITAGCYAFDYFKNPQLWHHPEEASASTGKGAHLKLWINHLCCSSCLDDVRHALAPVPGIDVAHAAGPKQLLTHDEANKSTTSLPDYGNTLDLPIADVEKLDLVALDKALRDKGLVAARMELEGVEHFRLEAKVDHLCCGMCDRAARERIAFLKTRGQGGQLKWLDSVNVDHDDKTIVAHARFVQPGKAVDVADFLGALNDAGYAPRSVQIMVHERQQMGGAMSDGQTHGSESERTHQH